MPFYNEESTTAAFLSELREALESLRAKTGADHPASCEVLLINDGSTDRTGEMLAAACSAQAGWRVIRFLRNRGQGAALYTGIHQARGSRLILLDGDGQNDPADLPKLLALLDAGADLAVGVRARRQDTWGRRAMSRLANTVRQNVLGDGVSDTGCGLKVMRREVAGAMIPLRTLYSFIPALAIGAGFRVAEIPVNHRERRGGESKYGVGRFLVWPLVDMLGVWWFNHRRCGADPSVTETNAV